jgi:hypothetical protein
MKEQIANQNYMIKYCIVGRGIYVRYPSYINNCSR